MNFAQQCIELTKRVGSWYTARDIIALEFGISDNDVSAMRTGKRQASEFQMKVMEQLIKQPPCPGYVTVAAMAKHLGVTRAWVHQLIKNGSIDVPDRDSFGRDVWREGVDVERIWREFTA